MFLIWVMRKKKKKKKETQTDSEPEMRPIEPLMRINLERFERKQREHFEKEKCCQ